jgi:dTDP-4-amino-4,6-dideoxygalactose transaminase
MSIMSGKSLATGEGGVMVTNDRSLYEKCIAYGHYERTGPATMYSGSYEGITDPELNRYAGLAIGGYKHRIHQLSSAVGRVQLKYYDERMAEIQAGMNRFWDLLEGVPGIKAHRPPKDSGSTMGGWYAAKGLYRADELGGLPCAKFCEAVTAEGVGCAPGANFPLYQHEVFHSADLFYMGEPTMISFGQRDVRQSVGDLPVSDSIGKIAYSIPWFKHDRPEIIEQYAAAYRKVAEHADELLEEEGY